MKQSLQELNSLARIIASILKDYSPVNLFENYVGIRTAIFKNYNKDQIGFPKEIKKPFGYKAILESFAKSLGFNTYEGLKKSGKIEFELDSFKCLKSLNPFPLNPFYTDMWTALYVGVVADFFENPLSDKLALGFKKDMVIAEWLRWNDGLNNLITETIEYDQREIVDLRFVPKAYSSNHYYNISTSMYSYALSKNVVLTSEEAIEEQMDSLLLREYVTFSDWGEDDFDSFTNCLIESMNALFNVKVTIIESKENLLDSMVILRHMRTDLEFPLEWSVECKQKLAIETSRVTQEALIKIAPSIENDNNLYRLDPDEMYVLYALSDFLIQGQCKVLGRDAELLDLMLFEMEFRDAETWSELGMQGRREESLIGTKMYILNLMRYEYPLGHKKFEEAPTVDDVLEYWNETVLNNLIPLKL